MAAAAVVVAVEAAAVVVIYHRTNFPPMLSSAEAALPKSEATAELLQMPSLLQVREIWQGDSNTAGEIQNNSLNSTRALEYAN